jgi:hypothetical protein
MSKIEKRNSEAGNLVPQKNPAVPVVRDAHPQKLLK